MSITLKWFLFGWDGTPTPPVVAVAVGGRHRRRPTLLRKRPRIETVLRTLAEDLAWEPPPPGFAEDRAVLELLLLGAWDD